MPEKTRLITIAISHYCEKARWGLERTGTPFVEQAHAPLFHRLATRSNGGGQTVPVLVTEAGTFADSTEILHHLDQNSPAKAKLYSTEPEPQSQVEKLEALFDKQLGPATRQWAYCYLMDQPSLVLRLWQTHVPQLEGLLLRPLFPLLFRFARQAMEINPSSAASSLATIQRVFQTVEDLLSDGRAYLVGDQFTAADLTFAALAAPVLLPPNRRVKAFDLEELPPEMAAKIENFRETIAGKYVIRLYQEERNLTG